MYCHEHPLAIMLCSEGLDTPHIPHGILSGSVISLMCDIPVKIVLHVILFCDVNSDNSHGS